MAHKAGRIYFHDKEECEDVLQEMMFLIKISLYILQCITLVE